MMDPANLLRLLQHIKVWIPPNNPIRQEIEDIMNQIRNQVR